MSLYVVRYERFLDKDNYDVVDWVCNDNELERLKEDRSIYSISIIEEIPELEF